ncbi:MAG: cysteine--tRNA ligase [Candidatus Fluviicola riflensis]|nr:MAG: cysteine--tRNA ligase [Candidatus Fluviicola riflensis]OGS77946.1 MAG: cysteine--tRNA ligase [Candidatus Fluviicola riflensis]OGS85011.1 MAG: cysteine--tRNA ligase [Fluviicola sp. RIFCSPHIGHO2_01_FULL_43_53]OGS89283.1 MAG: cysteine--tRNA ligase [Fluviicola sp. RIFCSPHIGHO2_12_FULL_43_24]
MCMNTAGELQIYNSLSGKKERFTPIHANRVGLYVCGPTLYSEPHMGNMRTFINFDMVYRYLLKLGYAVKYVRNITDAGHITNSAGEAVDSIGKAARLEQVQSLEIVYKYNVKFQELQRIYNMLPPSIEPTATAHIQEQIEIIEQILDNGFAYVVNGSVYFDVKAYSQKYNYGILSGRKIDELEEETRELNAQEEKRFFADFALWKKANPDDMQIWRSPWGDGNPGWHIECTAMSTKYLGPTFDIHGGGMDLKFPHHEDEIAQSCGAMGCNPANIWMHANMLNVNGQKMSKSLGNFFLPKEIVEGTSDVFNKPYSPNVLRFFMMQAHYRSTLDFTPTALDAAEKGFGRLTDALNLLEKVPTGTSSSFDVKELIAGFYSAMNDDFNAPILVANLFEAVKRLNLINDEKDSITAEDLALLKTEMHAFVYDVLGVHPLEAPNNDSKLAPVMDLVLELRQLSRENKDWTTSDKIRDQLTAAGIVVKDGKDGVTWSAQ